jgi:ABC-type transport system involved in cytochrome bd biosynthesis fused ATPase/permease subunit
MVDYRRLQFGNMNWRTRLGLFVGGAVAIALVLALAVVSLGVALILLPVAAVALLIARWRFRKLMAEAARESRTTERVIEVEYHRIDDEPR